MKFLIFFTSVIIILCSTPYALTNLEPADLTGSYLDAVATNYDGNSQYEIKFKLHLISPNNAWSDGMLLTFPSQVVIVSVLPCNASGGIITPVINNSENSVMYGNNYLTEWGSFHGDEELLIIVENLLLPSSINYVIYDDGFDSGEPTDPVDAVGEVTIDSIVQNTKPTLVLTLDKNEITVGDSVLIDYSSTYDSDGDNFYFNFYGTGSFNINEETKTAYFTPNPVELGLTNILVIASDSLSFSVDTAKVYVNPKLENIKIEYSYLDPEWSLVNYPTEPYITGYLFFYDTDTLFAPMSNLIRRYTIMNDGLMQAEDYPDINIDGIWAIKNNLLFAATEGLYGGPGYFGTYGSLSIYNLDNGEQILQDYLPQDSPSYIFDFYDIESEIYLAEWDAVTSDINLYKMDFSNPSSPVILSSVKIDNNTFNRLSLWKYDDQYIYFLWRGNSNYQIKQIHWTDLAIENKNLSITSDYTLEANDNNFIVYKRNYDTLSFYLFEEESDPVLLKKYSISDLFPNPFPSFYNSENTFWYISIKDSLMEIDGYGYSSSRFFDISNVDNIRYIGSWYGGGMNLHQQGDIFFINNSDPRATNINNPYSGINKVTLTGLTDAYEQVLKDIPSEYSLSRNYPNPFNPTTKITYSIPKAGEVSLKVFDVLGREVETLVNEEKPAGNYETTFDASDLPSGVYFYRLKANSFVETKKMIYLK